MHRNAAHRRAASSVLAAGCAAMLLGPLGPLGPSVAVAQADGENWDLVADCESAGDWSADTGNGFYGGLQFKESTWEAFGGHGSPADASRAEQIAVADRVLAGQGPGAWPTCDPGNVPAPTMTTWLPYPLRGLLRTLIFQPGL